MLESIRASHEYFSAVKEVCSARRRLGNGCILFLCLVCLTVLAAGILGPDTTNDTNLDAARSLLSCSNVTVTPTSAETYLSCDSINSNQLFLRKDTTVKVLTFLCDDSDDTKSTFAAAVSSRYRDAAGTRLVGFLSILNSNVFMLNAQALFKLARVNWRYYLFPHSASRRNRSSLLVVYLRWVMCVILVLLGVGVWAAFTIDPLLLIFGPSRECTVQGTSRKAWLVFKVVPSVFLIALAVLYFLLKRIAQRFESDCMTCDPLDPPPWACRILGWDTHTNRSPQTWRNIVRTNRGAEERLLN